MQEIEEVWLSMNINAFHSYTLQNAFCLRSRKGRTFIECWLCAKNYMWCFTYLSQYRNLFFFFLTTLFHCSKPFNLQNGVFRPEVIRKDRENHVDLIEMIRENEEWIPRNWKMIYIFCLSLTAPSLRKAQIKELMQYLLVLDEDRNRESEKIKMRENKI